MKKALYFGILVLIMLQSCLILEEDPIVILRPSINFQGYIQSDQIFISASLLANPDYITPGNIPTLFKYSIDLQIYNKVTGELLNTVSESGDGSSGSIEISATANRLRDLYLIASGTVSCSADKGSDADPSNDVFIAATDFNEVTDIADVVTLDEEPLVILSPSVVFQTNIRSSDLYATAKVNANPNFIVNGDIPVVISYSGVLQVFDETSGALLKSTTVEGSGYSTAVSILADTTSYSGMILIANGEAICSADVGADGDPSNDIEISRAEFYESLRVDLTE
jgi:hypothetical protein